MKTEISKFCEAYLTVLNSLPPTMRDATAAMEKGDADGLLQHPLAILNDTRARLRSLVEKLDSQQAYLLIFGPLKSGKSTLMNAISRSYVSEVTSLPGYPCLVYVRHGEKPHFSATRYNGRESVFANGQILKDVIADSHIALAAQIREAEERRGDFDPRHDFSEAIRRVDVKLPVPTLAESSTVLVDNPGLYSRMNFGYDRPHPRIPRLRRLRRLRRQNGQPLPRASLRRVQPAPRTLQPHLPRHQRRLQQARPPARRHPPAQRREPQPRADHRGLQDPLHGRPPPHRLRGKTPPHPRRGPHERRPPVTSTLPITPILPLPPMGARRPMGNPPTPSARPSTPSSATSPTT
ncbi:MAG: dynamin family protein [Chthoniobacter sp.]